VRFPESWSSTSLAKPTVFKHRRTTLSLTQPLLLLMGQPPDSDNPTVVLVLQPPKPEPIGLRSFWMRHPPAFVC
jgi:hypothetical protein